MADESATDKRHLPDREICRTRYLGKVLDISDCLVKDPEGCAYALRHGNSVFCRHPDRRSFEKTDMS